MNNRIITTVFCSILAIAAIAQVDTPDNAKAKNVDEFVGRSYKLFDTVAFCSYSSFHPSQYLTDNNWDILCAFVQPGTVAKLDSLGIPYSKSQIRLLEVGDLLSSDNGVYRSNE